MSSAVHDVMLATLTLAVERLDRLDELVPIVEQLGARHAGYGVLPEHYPLAGGALLWTLKQGLGPAFTPPVREAWTTAYGLLATTCNAPASALGSPRRAPDQPSHLSSGASSFNC